MAPLTPILVFVLCGCAVLTESTLRHGFHHGMMGMPMYGTPSMYPGMGMGMGMGMHHGGPMMYGMGPGFMHFSEHTDAEDGKTENNEKITPAKSESGIPELTPFQENNDHKSFKINTEPSGELNRFKDNVDSHVKSEEPTDIHLVKREVPRKEEKVSMDKSSDSPIIFPTEDDEEALKILEESKENAATESSIYPEYIHEPSERPNVSEKYFPDLAPKSDYLMIPVVQAADPVLFDSYANQRDVQTPFAGNSQSINQGLERQNLTPLNNYQQNIQNQVPMYGNQVNNGNGVPYYYNLLPVNNVGNTPGVLTLLTLPNNMGSQAGSVPNNQYNLNTVPQNIVNRAGIQNTLSSNGAPMTQPQYNVIGFLAQPNTLPLNNQYTNRVPTNNNQLVNMAPINNQPNNVLPVSTYVPANSYILVNSPQNVERLPDQAGLNAWNVPVGHQPLNYNQQPQIYSRQPQVYNQQPLNQQTDVVMLNRPPDNPIPQGNPAPYANPAVASQAQPLNNSQYFPVFNTKDEIVKEEINS